MQRNVWPSAGARGRASRSEFWYFWLFSVCCNLASFVLVAGVFDFTVADSIISAAIRVLSLPLRVRRLHDVNRSGWWILIGLTIVGAIPLLIWLVRKGDSRRDCFDIRGTPPGTTAPSSALEQVTRLHQLRLDGAITEEEYQTLKARAL